MVAHAYRSTLEQLRDRADEVSPILERHGIALRRDVLARPAFDVWESVGLGEKGQRVSGVTRDLRMALADLDALIG